MSAKTKTTLIVIACILAVALIAFLVWKMRKSDASSETTDPDFPLKRGSKGPKVRILQEYLNTQILKMQDGEVKPALLDVDGIFGLQTETACKMVFGTETISKTQYNEI